MLLQEITLRNLRLLQDVTIPFVREDGSPRRWTVFIGRNGTGKTSILQAIALAAAGNAGAVDLTREIGDGLPDSRAREAASIEAKFTFDKIGQQHGSRPLAPEGRERPTGLGVRVTLPPSRDPLRAVSWYTFADGSELPAPQSPATVDTDPLVRARQENLSHWFAVGYGMFRQVQDRQRGLPAPIWPSVDRLRPLFGPMPLIGPAFAEILHSTSGLHLEFGRTLRKIVQAKEGILPGIEDLELRGYGGVRSASDLMDRPRFAERVGEKVVYFPAGWFAHGHQSTLAWLSDLVGQVLLEAGMEVAPKDMEGIVLIDEIDLYLHPRWQVRFIHALQTTFPKLQFVATTHSPILLTGLRQDEVFLLERDPTTGNVQWRHPDRDPRLLTGSELYEEFFEIHDLYPTDLARMVDEYRTLAMNPLRPSDSEAEAEPPGAEEALLVLRCDPTTRKYSPHR